MAGGAKMARVKDREPPPPPYAPPAAGPPERHGAFGEAQSLYERMAGEASLRARADAASADARGALGKTLLALCVAAFFAAAATLLYGVIAFPDAPIREVATSYYEGKYGVPHTREEFERFKLWETTVFAAFGLTAALGIVAVAEEKLRRRESAR